MTLLLIMLLLLLFLSGFFSGSETALMAINRYRLQHLTKKQHPAAQRVTQLLSRPDRILSVILIGNTFVNVLASAIATVLAVRWFGEIGVIGMTALLTLFILIFAEIMPKTLSAFYPQQIAFLVSMPLSFLLRAFRPLVWLLSSISNTLLGCFGIKVNQTPSQILNRNELRAILSGMGSKLSVKGHSMLLNILDLEDITVNDIMVPLDEITGIDLSKKPSNILKGLLKLTHTHWILIYEKSVDQALGFLPISKAIKLLAQNKLYKKSIQQSLKTVRYVPEGTTLGVQLGNFQREKYQAALVVDEYGNVQGLISLSAILEEVTQDFPKKPNNLAKEVQKNSDGSYLVEGNVAVRDLNRLMGWELPTKGPNNTLSGLIIEHLGTIPKYPVSLRLADYPIEVLKIEDNRIKRAKIFPELK